MNKTDLKIRPISINAVQQTENIEKVSLNEIKDIIRILNRRKVLEEKINNTTIKNLTEK